MRKLALMLVMSMLLVPSLSHGDTITLDFNPTGDHPPVVTSTLVVSGEPSDLFSDAAYLGYNIHSVESGGVLFLDAIMGSSSTDGYGLAPGYAGQHGTIGILFPSMVNNVKLNWDIDFPVSTIRASTYIYNPSTNTYGNQTGYLGYVPPVMLLSDGTGFNLVSASGYGAKLDSISFDVPEPSTMLLLGSGLVGLGYLRRRRSRG